MKVNTVASFFNVREEQQAKTSVLILDGHNMIFRNLFMAHYIHNNEKEKRIKEQQTSSGATMYDFWKYMMANSLFSCIRQFKPDIVIFAIDAKNSWRKKVYAKYKANRKDLRDSSAIDFKEFFPIQEKFIEDLKSALSNIYFVEVDESEADDIVAIATTKLFANTDRFHVIVVSTDKDVKQLLQQSNVQIYDPVKRKFIECVNPAQLLEVAVLTGDKIDNVPAVTKRMGAKTAAKLLNTGLEVLLQDESIRKAYTRNRTLIDFKHIPQSVSNRIVSTLDTYQFSPIVEMNLLKCMIRNRLKRFIEDLQDFMPMLKRLEKIA